MIENALTLSNQRIRKSFAKLECAIGIPNLIDIQKESYEKFLQYEAAPDKRENFGLQSVFNSVFPIHDFNGTASLEFESFSFEKPKYDVDECRARRMTYAAPIKITVRLVVWDVDQETGSRNIRDVKVQEVYLGEIPLMTETGSFIVNGTERVVVSQLHRSPGVFYDHDSGTTHSSGKLLYNARVIPYRGSWLDFEFDHKDLIYVRIDRRRKMPATVLLKALGLDNQQILDGYYKRETIQIEDSTFAKVIDWDLLSLQRAEVDIDHPKTKKPLVRKGKRFGKMIIEKLKEAKIKDYPIEEANVVGKVAAAPIVDKKSGEVIVELNEKLTPESIAKLRERGVKQIEVLFIDGLYEGGFLSDTLRIDRIDSQEEALIEIYKRLRPGDPPTIEASRALFENLFFNPARYDLSKVGRLKINHKFNFDLKIEDTTLRVQDIVEILRYLVDLRNGRGQVDDIDHLGNRRVRPVGELLENQFRIGLVRMERTIRERMSLQEIDTLMPYDLINAKPISAVVKEFFGSSQLSQFMDQTNPLSEVTHKRRLSALGPGGLTRERAGFEVRDVHPTHYGRICPIETPEGPNIGLISSLSTYARVNEFGFVETPYAKVEDGKVTDTIRYYSALEEERHIIAQANSPVDEKSGKFTNEFVQARKAGETVLVPRDEVDLMDVSPTQLVSVAAALIPFLENDDANRALMGSNMQRQAVPLIRTSAPLVGTGMERKVAGDSGGDSGRQEFRCHPQRGCGSYCRDC
jgi:DNA-directed RNA polymerase subunit beta